MPNHTSRRILIACEQPLEAQALEGVLRSAGYQHVRATSDGREISKLLEKWPFALLILDLSLSTKSAALVLSEFSEAMDARNLCVLALSNAGDLNAQAGALRAGAMDVFTRPATHADTLDHVSIALSQLSRKIA